MRVSINAKTADPTVTFAQVPSGAVFHYSGHDPERALFMRMSNGAWYFQTNTFFGVAAFAPEARLVIVNAHIVVEK
jgi:hypothetical protein